MNERQKRLNEAKKSSGALGMIKADTTHCSGFNPKDVEIYDNEGESFDRYTIIIDDAYFGMSLHPHSPQGFNQYCGTTKELRKDRDALGKKVDFKDLSQEVQQAIIERMRHE